MNVKIKCTCSLKTGCGEGDQAGCEVCAVDNYEACPVFGFMCYPPVKGTDGRFNPCMCCSSEQRENTRKWYENGS